MVNVAVDAMGGDNAPAEIVKGAVQAIAESEGVKVFLVGREELITKELSAYTYDTARVEVVHAEEVIEMAEPPVMAIRKKKDSSIVKAMNMVKDGTCDAFVSAGSTGAVLVGGQVIVGRIKGVERPPLAPLIPTLKGVSLLVDCGANVDARPSHLVQFAKMGSIYMENVVGVKNPKVAIVNIGAEEEKGNALVKETFPLLKNCPEINFVGSIEARDIPTGAADVVVCEAFVGNVILKMYEGVGGAFMKKIKEGMMTSLRSKIGALLVKPALKKTLKSFDTEEYGGAPMLGLKGLVVKTHGSSKANEIKNSILQCIAFKEQNINEKIRENIKKENKKEGRNMEFDKLRNIIAEVLNVDPEEITLETTFVDDLGADSLDVFQIVMGIDEETFGIGKTLTREEMATLVYRALEKNGYSFEEAEAAVFTDFDSVSDYAKTAVSAMSNEGLINGFPEGNFLPGGLCTRAQMAVVISQACQKLAK